ncbi:uncharacterized protein LOC110190678 [Drosophila serrata]|uniref:uncharacterized protein LOC110190678 n=1 Tax=Drosophila serrata TaxID=7274 RepID=UPI000A1CF61A|nr:uncharacterized protein LOC110190678 [Drosophila serrata]KAH8384488.1 hypothetical protein KR200_011452 [Drosophila serrata]
MSSRVGELDSGVGSSGSEDMMTMDPTEHNFALELKPAPKQLCIPMHQRLTSSETNVFHRDVDYEVPDKSWSVLYIGTTKEKALK